MYKYGVAAEGNEGIIEKVICRTPQQQYEWTLYFRAKYPELRVYTFTPGQGQ